MPGYAEGEALVSPEPISGWGGIDPAAGRIIEPRTADLDVPPAELQRRRDALRAPARTHERGWLSIYQRLVRPLPEGAVLREPAP